MSGFFITFEGGEGAGKTTQIKILEQKLKDLGRDVVRTRELGGTTGAEKIRTLVQSGEVDAWDAKTEILLIFGARRDHTEKLIKPALASNWVVLCDRYFDTTYLYQGLAQGVNLTEIDAIRHFALGDFKPDLTLLFDIDPEVGLVRALEDAKTRPEENTRFERKGLAFHERVRNGIQLIKSRDPERCQIIDAGRPREDVSADIWAIVSKALGING
jgi:dTMP kinase